MKNFSDATTRCLILLINVVILMSSRGAELIDGNFGAARPSTPGTPIKRKETPKTGAKSYPYSGTLESVDPNGKFITLKGKSKNRQILVNAETRYSKNDRAATLNEGAPGTRVTGSVKKNESGQEEAISVHFSEKVATTSAKKMPVE
jgi:hypothetical protein